MWDAIKDYIILILGTFFATIELIRNFKKEKASKLYITILIIGIILFIWLGIDQINRNKTDKREADTKIQSLIEKVGDIQKNKTQDSINRVNDSINNIEFKGELFKKFNIRDSANKPIINNYNTRIKKADNVKIGG